jgi:hypothetical protein
LEQQRDAAARQDPFLDRGPGCMHRVIDTILALLDLDLGRTADPDHRDAAGELRQPRLQLLAVVVGGGFLDLRLDLGNPGLDVGLIRGTTTVDRSSRFMVVILRTAVCVAALMCFADTALAIAKKARLVCEYGRCWQTGAGYDYQYGYRPPTKWELKGFCPPGQAKKGNC